MDSDIIAESILNHYGMYTIERKQELSNTIEYYKDKKYTGKRIIRDCRKLFIESLIINLYGIECTLVVRDIKEKLTQFIRAEDFENGKLGDAYKIEYTDTIFDIIDIGNKHSNPVSIQSIMQSNNLSFEYAIDVGDRIYRIENEIPRKAVEYIVHNKYSLDLFSILSCWHGAYNLENELNDGFPTLMMCSCYNIAYNVLNKYNKMRSFLEISGEDIEVRSIAAKIVQTVCQKIDDIQLIQSILLDLPEKLRAFCDKSNQGFYLRDIIAHMWEGYDFLHSIAYASLENELIWHKGYELWEDKHNKESTYLDPVVLKSATSEVLFSTILAGYIYADINNIKITDEQINKRADLLLNTYGKKYFKWDTKNNIGRFKI